MGADEKDTQGKNRFSIPAPILQAKAFKSSIRELNAEFQREGGSVAFKNTKKGSFVQLSHKDQEYLEGFRVRLYRELDLSQEGPGERSHFSRAPTKPGGSNPHRYPDRDGHPRVPGSRPAARFPVIPRGREIPVSVVAPESSLRIVQPSPDEKGLRQGRGRLSPPELHEFLISFIHNMVRDGGIIDDGQIIREAYERKFSQRKVRALRKILWNNRCRSRKDCPHNRRKFRFEEMMKICGKGNCEMIDSPLKDLYDDWRANLDDMFLEFLDRKVIVRGKISEYKLICREGEPDHYKILIFDTLVQLRENGWESSSRPKETRKLWMRIPEDRFIKFNADTPFKVEDIVEIQGEIKWSDFFHDYWIVNIEGFKIVFSKGEKLIRV